MKTMCRICGQAGQRAQVAQLGEFGVTRCEVCDGESVVGGIDDGLLRNVYQSFDAGQLARDDLSAYTRQARAILERIFSDPKVVATGGRPSGLFLDYGCGGGHFALAARELGFKAYGMEVDDSSVASGLVNGIEMIQGSLPQDIRRVGTVRFNVVVAMHVLEHAHSPFDVLCCLRDLSDRNSLFLVGVPDQYSFPAGVKKFVRLVGIKRGEWGFVQPPVHLHGFGIKTFETMAETCGLDILWVQKTSPLDSHAFPTTPRYWKGLTVHRAVYGLGRALGSGGHLTALLRCSASA